MKLHTLLIIGVIILFIFIFITTYWKVQLLVNIDQVGMNAHSKFYTNNKEKMSLYKDMVNLGSDIAKQKRIVICGMVRNVENNVSKIIKKVERLANKFLDYKILIVENDSKDLTRKLLLEWAKRNPKVVILGCGRNAPTCSINIAKSETTEHSVTRERIVKMAYLRNIYLQEIQAYYPTFDYAVIWDLDIVGTVYLEGIYNSLAYLEGKNIAAICAYGSRCFGDKCIYYDTYAHKDYEKDYNNFKNSVGEDNYKRIVNVKLIGDPIQRVISCFSGFAIYKIPSLLHEGIFYDTNKEIECEHTIFNEKIQSITGQEIYMNPSMLHLVLNNDY